MSVDLILALLVVAIVANLVVMIFLVASPVVRRAGLSGANDRPDVAAERAMAAAFNAKTAIEKKLRSR